MAGWLGNGVASTQKVIKYSALQVTTSQYDIPVCLYWGQRRLSPNVIWYGDFKAKKVNPKGKGGAVKGQTQYDYSAAVILALGEGVISSPVNVFANGSTTSTTTLSKLGFTFFDGDLAQSPWSYTETHHPDQALSYAGTAYIANPRLDFGATPSIPDFSLECQRTPFTDVFVSPGWKNPTNGHVTDGHDCNMADILDDLLTNVRYGMGFSSGDIPDLTLFRSYQAAQGLFFSPLLVNQEKATSIIDRWAQITNTWIYWSGTQFMLVPLGDQALTANGYTYTPDLDVAYTLQQSDLIYDGSEPPITVERIDPADAKNRTVLEITDRTMGYVSNPKEYRSDALIDRYGLRDNSSTQADEICCPTVGEIAVQLIGKRAAYIRNTYKFKTTWRFIRCLPGTILQINDANIGLVNTRVRVKTIDENEDGTLSFACEEFPSNIGTYYSKSVQPGPSPSTPNTLVDPPSVNVPAVVEPSTVDASGTSKVIIAASGGDHYGGCNVYLSFDGGTTYSLVGKLTSAAIQGVLTANLASYGSANPDTTNTLSVDCTESLGEPEPVTNADASSLRTLSLVCGLPTVSGSDLVLDNAGELLAFGDVTATGTYTADLTYLYRGTSGTPSSAHSSGDLFTLFDMSGTSGSTLLYELPAQYVGQTLYIKLAAFNEFGEQTQDLSVCQSYKYTPTGVGFGGGTGGVPTAPTGLVASSGIGQNSLSWNANPSTDNVLGYKIYRANGTGASFGSASLIASVGLSITYIDNAVTTGSGYTYFVVANNAIGDSSASAGADCTTSGTVQNYLRVSFATPGRAPGAGEELSGAPMIAGDKLLAADAANWQIVCEVAPAADWTVTFKQAGSTVGTATILLGNTSGTFTWASDVTFSSGDQYVAVCPSPADSNIKGVGITQFGKRA